jgi:hypothetical protein
MLNFRDKMKGGLPTMTEEEKELYERLNRLNKQDETLRKLKGEGEPYKDLSKGKNVKVYTNDKKAMKFWEE